MNFTKPGYFMNYTSPSTSPNDLDICLLCIDLLFALPAHSYVIWVIATGTGSGVVSEFFVLNLSVCEIGNCLNSLIYVLSYWISCFDKLSEFLEGLAFTGRPLFQCLICVERYLAVVHPVTFLKYKPLRYRVICCSVAWIIAFGFCVCLLVMFLFYNSNVQTWFFLLQFLFFLSIQLFCLVAVLKALKQSGPGERGRVRVENDMKRRAFYLILISTVTMLIINVPYNIIAIFHLVAQKNIYKLWYIVVICYLLASLVQPILYLYRAEKLSYISEILHCPI